MIESIEIQIILNAKSHDRVSLIRNVIGYRVSFQFVPEKLSDSTDELEVLLHIGRYRSRPLTAMAFCI